MAKMFNFKTGADHRQIQSLRGQIIKDQNKGMIFFRLARWGIIFSALTLILSLFSGNEYNWFMAAGCLIALVISLRAQKHFHIMNCIYMYSLECLNNETYEETTT